MNLTDKAWEALRINKTDFTEGVHSFNGCPATITKREDPYGYVTGTGRHSTMSSRYWGKVVLHNGKEEWFEDKRGGQIARRTGFFLKKERPKFLTEGDAYVLPYLRK
jgi:hypothetical protein